MIDKEHIKGFFMGAAAAVVLVVSSVAFADPPASSLRPNASVGADSKAMLGATRLFRVDDCEVWGFTWKDQARVVAVCPRGPQVVAVLPNKTDSATTTAPTVPVPTKSDSTRTESKPTVLVPASKQ